MRLEAALLSGFLAGHFNHALASGIDAAHALHHRHADFHDHMRREADAMVHQYEKRHDVFNAPGGIWPTVVVPSGYTLAGGVELTPVPTTRSPGSQAAATPTPAPAAAQTVSADVAAQKSVNTSQWSAEAQQACMAAVMNLKGQSSNPAGLAVCYNVPYLDQQNGVFEAELRMYNVCAPTGDFVGMSPTDMMVTLSYADATIQLSNGTLPSKRSLGERQVPATPTGTTGSTSNGILMPVEVTVRQYVGQINKDLMQQGMTLTQYRAMLVPQISISATNPLSQKSVNTSLSSTEASFNAGVFANAAGNSTDPKSILGHPQEQIAAAAAGLPTPFDVPGLALGVFPTGLIVTSIWLALFVGVVGAGTLGRVQFRDQYRRSIKAQKEELQRRI